MYLMKTRHRAEVTSGEISIHGYILNSIRINTPRRLFLSKVACAYMYVGTWMYQTRHLNTRYPSANYPAICTQASY